MVRSVFTIAAVALLYFSTQVEVNAGPITYAITTTATGTLGASQFTNASVTLTLKGDTSGVTAGPGPLSSFLINPGMATLAIGGLGSATITDSIEILSTLNADFGTEPAVVIVDTTDGGPQDPTGILWTLAHCFWAITFRLPLARFPALEVSRIKVLPTDFFSTTAGNFQFAAGQGGGAGNSIFTAAIVPEPSPQVLSSARWPRSYNRSWLPHAQFVAIFVLSGYLRLPPRLTQTVKTQLAVR
jgi:hypothetical protein